MLQKLQWSSFVVSAPAFRPHRSGRSVRSVSSVLGHRATRVTFWSFSLLVCGDFNTCIAVPGMYLGQCNLTVFKT